MRAMLRVIGVGLIVAWWNVASGTPATRAQMAISGPGRSLRAATGASTITSYYGGGSTAYLPYMAGMCTASCRTVAGSGGGLGAGVAPDPPALPRTSIGGAMLGRGHPIGGGSRSGAG